MDNTLPSSEVTPAAPESHVIETPVEHHEQPVIPSAPVTPPAKRKSPLLMIGIAILVVALGIGGYFVMDMLNTPMKVKGNVSIVQPAFTDYSRAIKKVSDYMLDESGKSDSDSIERSVAKGKGLIKEADRTEKTLSRLLQDMTIPQASDYKSAIEKYIEKARMMQSRANADVVLGEAYVEPLRKLEKLTVAISGASNYLYSDPEKYTEIVGDAVKEVDAITTQLESAKASGDLQESHELFIKTMKEEKIFLEAILDAVKNRKTDAIATATQDYAQQAQQLQKDNARISDKMKETTQEQSDDLQELQDAVEDKYRDLKAQYKF